MENKKNIVISIVIGIIVVGLFISTMFIGEKEYESISSEDPNVIVKNAENESLRISNREMKELKEISMTEYLDYYNAKDLSIVFLGRPTCPFCEISKPIVGKIAKDEDLTIYYLNTDNFSDDDKVQFIRHNELFSEGYSTPMLLVISNGKINFYQEGLTDTEHYIRFFESNGLINK